MIRKKLLFVCEIAFSMMAVGLSTLKLEPQTAVFGEVVIDNISWVGAGFHHSLALSESGQIYTFGEDGSYQLGDGNTTDKSSPVYITDALGGESISALANGQNHSFAITSTGKLYGWGTNSSLQLDDGTTTDIPTPTLIAATLGGESISSISCGYYHSFAITSTGKLYTWGNNWCGQLGDGTTTDIATPTLIAETLGGEAIAMAVGGHVSSMALTTSGKLYTWGNNDYGQLGIGRQYGSYTTPTFVASKLDGNTIVAIASGFRHSLALTSNG